MTRGFALPTTRRNASNLRFGAFCLAHRGVLGKAAESPRREADARERHGSERIGDVSTGPLAHEPGLCLRSVTDTWHGKGRVTTG
jgi:hypothetical protein